MDLVLNIASGWGDYAIPDTERENSCLAGFSIAIRSDIITLAGSVVRFQGTSEMKIDAGGFVESVSCLAELAILSSVTGVEPSVLANATRGIVASEDEATVSMSGSSMSRLNMQNAGSDLIEPQYIVSSTACHIRFIVLSLRGSLVELADETLGRTGNQLFS